MKKVLALLALLLVSNIGKAVYADTINLSENWYVRITNFSLQGQMGPDWFHPAPVPINLVGFSDPYDYQHSTTTLIEPKLQNPLSDGTSYGTLLFDFHEGQASTDDTAGYLPYATLGSGWTATMSFHWQIYCTDPNVLFRVHADNGGPEYVWWSAPVGSGNRSGNVTLDVSTWGGIPPSFHVSFATVPEPTSILAVTMFTVGFICRRRRTH